MITIENPIELRRHERRWKIPDGTCRTNVAWDEEFSDAVPAAAQTIRDVYPPGAWVVFECRELYTPERHWRELFPEGIHDISERLEQKDVLDCVSLREERALKILSHDFVFMTSNLDKLESYLAQMIPLEWRISIWRDPPSLSPILEFIKRGLVAKRDEELYLTVSLLDAELIIFLAPNHSHMEIMTCKPERQRCVEQALAGC